jgi:hypothetical protein
MVKRAMPLTTGVTSALIRWVTYSVVFALLPVAIVVFLRGLASKLSWNDLASSPEFLFFAIMLNATALGDLSELAPALRKESLYRCLHSALLLAAVISAVFYGCLVFEGIFATAPGLFRWRLLLVSFGLDGVSLILSTAAEILLARIRD